MYTASAPVFGRMLHNTLHWIALAEENAASRGFDPEAFFSARLAPDMLPFCSQVRIATDHAKGCCARLAQRDVPAFEDNEASLAELKERLSRTIAFVEGVDPQLFDGSETREIELKLRKVEMKMAGEAYLHTFALPNFYFHLTTAYAILRANGVGLGKRIFLAGAA